MFSAEKSGKLKRQIDRYFLPIEINPAVILDIIRNEDKKTVSPNKIRQETLSKLSEEAQKFEMLRVTGRQLNSNFVPLPPKVTKEKFMMRESKMPKMQLNRTKIQQILAESLQTIVEALSKDSESYLFAKQLQQMQKHKNCIQQGKTLKTNHSSLPASFDNEASQSEFLQSIMSNPTLYKKVLLAYHKLDSQKPQHNPSSCNREKRPSLSEAVITKRGPRSFKKAISTNQRQMGPQQLKKFNNFTQYRQFLMLVNLSNKIVVFPESDAQYKGYICKGNNGLLVKSIIKTRPWWALRSVSDIQNCNLVWTEWKKTKLTNSLPSKETKSQKASFYTSNYYQRINQSEIRSDLTQAEDKKNAAKTEICCQVICAKQIFINRISDSEKILPSRYINGEQMESNYYVFTKKINEKKFEETSKRYLPPHSSYYCYNHSGSKKERPLMILNHVPGCYQLHSKKLLFLNMKRFYERNSKMVFDYLPQTYLIKDGIQDANYLRLAQRWQELEAEKNDPSQKLKTKNVWICKPGENSNRGNGITVVSTLEEIRAQIKSMNSHHRSLIVQKYMESPYLYNKRKFDIRCYLLITTVNGIIKGYFFNEGYIRTTSKQYSLKNLENKFIHLTNDAIQKKGEEYGKYESCNKVSFWEFEKYLESVDKQECAKFLEARKNIKQIVAEATTAVAGKLNPARKQFCFELFGFDFMLDSKMKPFLIEANSNPCLEVDGSVLSKIIPALVENTIRIAVDPLYPPPYSENWKTSRFCPGNAFEVNKYELIYDSLSDPSLNLRESTMEVEELRELQEEEDQCEKEGDNQVQ